MRRPKRDGRSMGAMRPKQLPLTLDKASKRAVHSQFAALPFRVVDGETKILLVTTRRTKRWILPKGWPEPGMTPAHAAAREAWEEAGVRGRAYDLPLGVYGFVKMRRDHTQMPVLAVVYPLQVERVSGLYPERHERRRKWFSPKGAAARVAEPELARLLKTFDPRVLDRATG
ncbi:MAG: NUDIX hydrolase [Shimia sp.]